MTKLFIDESVELNALPDCIVDLFDLADKLWEQYHAEQDRAKRRELRDRYNEVATAINNIRKHKTVVLL